MKFEPLDIDDAFEAFMRKCYSEVPAHTTQYRECRRVFYSGVLTLLIHLRTNVSEIPDDDGVAELESIDRQCQEFFKKRLFQDKD